MKTVEIHASRSYRVKIGTGLLSTLGQEAVQLGNVQTVMIVSDSTVWPLWGAQTKNALEAVGLNVQSFVFPAGEESKNGTTYLNLLNCLAEHQLTRTDLLVALGGGVVGDLTGFAAATFLRGIRFIQIPTTLLAAVDSSVGGKTAIDLPSGKNLVGAFYQPSLVLCDVELLNTLPPDIFRDGCAEVIKYGILYDPELFSHLAKFGLHFHREEVISRCVELKRNVVMEDEFDTGLRMKLNLGHTIGHGVEAHSHFTVTHGKAVAIGIAIVTRAAATYGICDQEAGNQILSILEQFDLPTQTDASGADLFLAALSDKKRSGNTVNLIVPASIGSCLIRPTPVEELKPFIEAGL